MSNLPVPSRGTAPAAHAGFAAIFAPTSRADAWELCRTLSEEKWIASCFRGNPTFVAIALSFGTKFGLEPLSALTSIAVINGKPAIYGDMALALVRRSYPNAIYQERYLTDRTGCEVTVRRNPNQEPVVELFDEPMARTAGLWGKPGPWTNYPRRMCMWRARGYALRTAFPDVMCGFLLAEEAMDIVSIESDGAEVLAPPTIKPSGRDNQRGLNQESDDVRRTKALFAMEEAETIADLVAAGKAFGVTNASDAEIDDATALYKRRKAELTGLPPPPEPEQPPTDEPNGNVAEPPAAQTKASSSMDKAKRAMSKARIALEQHAPKMAQEVNRDEQHQQ